MTMLTRGISHEEVLKKKDNAGGMNNCGGKVYACVRLLSRKNHREIRGKANLPLVSDEEHYLHTGETIQESSRTMSVSPEFAVAMPNSARNRLHFRLGFQ